MVAAPSPYPSTATNMMSRMSGIIFLPLPVSIKSPVCRVMSDQPPSVTLSVVFSQFSGQIHQCKTKITPGIRRSRAAPCGVTVNYNEGVDKGQTDDEQR